MRHRRQTHTRLFEEVILKSWWVILFFLICFFAYDRSSRERKKEEAHLREKLSALAARKEHAGVANEDLNFQIVSQQDHDWIELVLKRRLGVVPEGETKIIFKMDEKNTQLE